MKPPINLPPDLPAEVVPVLVAMGYLDEDRLKPGDTAPVLTLGRLDSDYSITIGELGDSQPTVLIFGSYT